MAGRFSHGPLRTQPRGTMANQARQQVSDSSQVNARVNSFHIGTDLVSDADGIEGDGDLGGEDTNRESAAAQDGPNASDFGLRSEDADADKSDSDEPKDSDGSETQDGTQDGGDPRIAKLETRIAKAEDMERRWQSRYDRAQAQLDRLLATQASPSTATDGDSVIESLEDTGVVTGADLKKILKAASVRNSQHLAKTNADSQRQAWVASRPDIQAVTTFMKDHDLYGEDSPLRQIPTDEVGLYHAALAMKLENDI